MNEFIDFLTKLGALPFVTIPIGAFLGYLLKGKQDKTHDERVTKQALSLTNIEIHENFINLFNSKYPYKELNFKGFEFINTHAGNIRINNDQLTKINGIYTLFDEINKKILIIREVHNSRNLTLTAKLAEELKELQKRCRYFAGDYVKETYLE